MIPRAEFDRLLKSAGLPASGRNYGRFARYAGRLLEWNGRMNLTAITDGAEIAEKHFVDSLMPLRFYAVPAGAALLDVGSGAGFPGLPIRIVRPDLAVTFLDSLRKRLDFLRAVTRDLGLEADFVHARAEEAGRTPGRRERYAVVTARAVAPLPALAEYCLPFLEVGGVFLALKGTPDEEELSRGGKAAEALGGVVERTERYALPGGDWRTLLVIRKNRPTPDLYPRSAARIRKRPL